MSGGIDDQMAAAPATPEPPRRRRAFAREVVAIAAIGVLLAGAIVAGGASVSQAFYSPTAFVLHYLGLLSDGRAADALDLPGVALDADALAANGLPSTASDALLRGAALGSLGDIVAESEVADGDRTRVTVRYTAGGHPGRTTFVVARDGSAGLAPTWRFATSPLAVVDLTLLGATTFRVNGFGIDVRQLSDSATANPPGALPCSSSRRVCTP